MLYCRQGNESTLSAPMLKQMGYGNIAVLQGGFAAWKNEGLPSEQGLGAQSEFEALAVAKVGLFGSGPYGYSNERMAQYLKDEEELGERFRRQARRSPA